MVFGLQKKYIGNDQVGAGKIRLENNTALRARNFADDADIDLMKVNESDVFQLLRNLDFGNSAINIMRLARDTNEFVAYRDTSAQGADNNGASFSAVGFYYSHDYSAGSVSAVSTAFNWVEVAAADAVDGNTYRIKTTGTTDWTQYGAASNTVGAKFVMTGGPATGDGTLEYGEAAMQGVGHDGLALTPRVDADFTTKKYVDDSIADLVIPQRQAVATERIVLSATDISNKYVDLAAVPAEPLATILFPLNGYAQFAPDAFEIITDGSEVKRLSWNGKLLDGVLAENDIIRVNYHVEA